MFLIRRPTEDATRRFLEIQRRQPFAYPETGRTSSDPPAGYVVDHNRIRLGSGDAAFASARLAVTRWKMFELGWVELLWPDAPITAGTTVAVLARCWGFWSLNAARIVYTVNEPRRFGFAYGTLPEHVERGEERFLVEWLPNNEVWYDILAFSRPNSPLIQIGYPLARRLQKRFARDSMGSMSRAVQS